MDTGRLTIAAAPPPTTTPREADNFVDSPDGTYLSAHLAASCGRPFCGLPMIARIARAAADAYPPTNAAIQALICEPHAELIPAWTEHRPLSASIKHVYVLFIRPDYHPWTWIDPTEDWWSITHEERRSAVNADTSDTPQWRRTTYTHANFANLYHDAATNARAEAAAFESQMQHPSRRPDELRTLADELDAEAMLYCLTRT